MPSKSTRFALQGGAQGEDHALKSRLRNGISSVSDARHQVKKPPSRTSSLEPLFSILDDHFSIEDFCRRFLIWMV
jgi:hypothetical protein